MFCPNCGKELNDKEINFCPACGKNLDSYKGPKTIEPTINKFTAKKLVNEIRSNEPKSETTSNDTYTKKPQIKPDNEKKLTNKKPKQRKWGWGWYFVAFIVFSSVDRDQGLDDNLRNALSLFALIGSILIYFLFRNKFFKEFKNVYWRAIAAGGISVISTFIIVILIVKMIPTERDLYNEFLNRINSLQVKLINEGIKINQELIDIDSKYIDDPSTKADYEINRTYANSFSKVYIEKLKINRNFLLNSQELLDTYKDELNAIPRDLFPPKSLYDDLLNDVDSLIVTTETCYNYLANYYTAIVNGKDGDNYYNNFETLSYVVESYENLFNENWTTYINDHINTITKKINSEKYLKRY